jgi:hypothetical protein
MKKALAAMAAFAVSLTGGALAQGYPGDAGAGIRRGIQELNNSGQIGWITLQNRGNRTLVDIDMHGTGARIESATIRRGKSCGDVTSAAWRLHNVVRDRSSTIIDAPIAKVLAGNYTVILYRDSAHAVACGHLFLT